jgi:ATP-binding cassette subfamily B protein
LLFGFLEERLTGTADIRANGAVAYTMQRFYQRSRDLLWRTLRAIFMGNTLFLASRTLFALGTAGALALAIYLFDQRLIALGTTYLIYRYTELLSRPLENISRQIQDLQQAGAGLLRVQALLATRNPMQDGPQQVPDGPLSVEFRDVTFGYAADEPILRDVSFQLEPGRVLGLLGRTGSGKTSITRLLFRLYDVNAGQVLVGGVDVRQAHRQQLRQRIGMVTQSIQLFHATVRDNLTFFDATVPDERIIQVLQELGMGPWLAQLPQGLDTSLQAGGGGISAGQAQLLAFARVFLHDAGLVILDEASSRLDPATERYIEKAVQRLLEERTVIIIAHRLNTVMQADEIMVLENGRVIEHGDRAALAADPYSRFATLLRTGLDEEEPAGPADDLLPLEVLDGR